MTERRRRATYQKVLIDQAANLRKDEIEVGDWIVFMEAGI